MATIPRIMIAAPSSGTGKTTVTLALLSALKKRGLSPVAFKCGPDYIDPMFHREVLGLPSYNLDLFFTSEETVRGLFIRHAAGRGIAVIEGVMGYYDGSGAGTKDSSYGLASAVDAPVILVVSAHGAALSIAATIRGFKDFRPDSRIAGVILNHCSKALFDMMKHTLESETGLKMLGYFPRLKDCVIGSRHLGLVTAAEIDDLKQKLDRLGEEAEQCVDMNLLIQAASSAKALSGSLPEILPIGDNPRVAELPRPRIAVAQDAAFCFYYADNLELLERFGAELVPFSPLGDKALPEKVGALYLGGGYPELYAKVLSENTAMLDSIRHAVSGGLPTFAECGGFMYLQDTLEDEGGSSWPMIGAIHGQAVKTSSLQRFGYINLSARQNNMLCRSGDMIPAHEFHYWDSTENGSDCTARKPNGREWPCVIANETLFAGYPHLYFYGNPVFAENFVRAAMNYAENRK